MKEKFEAVKEASTIQEVVGYFKYIFYASLERYYGFSITIFESIQR